MKSNTLLRNAIVLLMTGSVLFLNSCKKDDDTNKPAPTISVSSATASNQAGLVATTTVSVDAPEGGKTLAITVNGAPNSAVPDVTLDGSANQDVPVSFTIPANAEIGATYLFSFQATDKKDQKSNAGTFLVTVSEFPNKEIVDVPAGSIITDTHWTADKIYRLNGFVRVGEDTHAATPELPTIKHTAVLTIDAGTVIYGKTGAPGGTLVVQRGSKIIANGTADQPIIFTSESAPNFKTSGDWGGVVICGQATNNTKNSGSTGTDGIEELEGAYGGFHGGGAASNDADNSGSLQYVRIEFAGYPINPNQELNGLTMGSVGSGTTIDHVQVSYSNDDSFEWFGGTVAPRHLIAFKGLDDDFDTDNGFSGTVQFGIAIRDPNIADQSGSNGFESDNDASGNDRQPYTNATFSNMTIIGGKEAFNTAINIQFQHGAQIRRRSKLDIINSFITGFPTGIFIDDNFAGSVAAATAGDLNLKNNVLAGVEKWGGNGYGKAATTDELTITGLPFDVPQTTGSSTLGNYDHVVNPKGLLVGAGTGGYSGNVFNVTVAGTISGQSGLNWFKQNNSLVAKWNDASLGLSSTLFNASSAPTVLPTAGSALLSGAEFGGYTGFTSVSYKGAFGTEDWTTGWTSWNPQANDYSK